MKQKLLLLFALFVGVTAWGQSYTDVKANTTGAWNTSRWNNSANVAPYTSTFTSANAVNFPSGTYEFLNGIGTGTVTVGNVTVGANTSVTFTGTPAGTLNTGVGVVSTIDVGAGGLFNIGTQPVSASTSTGFIKTGAGVFVTGSTGNYVGGFTLNAGTVLARSSTALGSGTTNKLTLNGGIFAVTNEFVNANGVAAFTNTRFQAGIFIGGTVQFGDTSLNLANARINSISFGSAVTLNSVNSNQPVLLIGNSSTCTFGVIGNGTASSVTFGATNTFGSDKGSFILSVPNIYTIPTIVSGGILQLKNTGGTTLPITNSVSVTGGTLKISTNQQLADLTIGAGGTLVVDAGVTLTITGTLSNAGSITNNGTITAPAGALILKSDINGSGYIANSSGAFTNAITIQKYISGGRRTSRFLGHPFSNDLTMASLIDNIYITGDGTTAGTGGATPGAGFDATTSNAASAFWFDNGVAQTWKAFTSTSDVSWTKWSGIRVLVRGNRYQPTALTGGNPIPNAVTLDMTGTLNTGAQTIPVPTGYSVLGNPYPSPVDLGTRLDALTAGVIGTQYWVWDANAGPTAGAYVTKTIGSGAYNLSMNGAFVVSPVSPTNIPFVESDKQATATTNLFRTNTLSGQLELQVLYNNYPADNMFVRFNALSSDNKEAFDGAKLSNPEVNIYALSADNKKLSLDTRPFADNKIIPFGFTATAVNSFKIKVADYGITEETYLKDKYLNVTTQLVTGTEYSFSVDPSISATLGENRFELVMKTNSALPTTILSLTAVQKNAGIEVTWNTANETNMNSYEVEESTDGINFSKATTVAAKNTTTNNYIWFDAKINNGDNYYRIKSLEKSGTAKYSNIVKVKLGEKVAEFTVYPNPVKAGIVSLQMSYVDKGIYTVKIYNNIGEEVANRTINHTGGSATQTINLGKSIAQGTYYMKITNGTTVITKTVIVK